MSRIVTIPRRTEGTRGIYIERERERKWSVPLGHSTIAIQRDLRDRNSADNNARFQPFGAERDAEYFIQRLAELAVLQPNILGDRVCIVFLELSTFHVGTFHALFIRCN